MSAGTKVGLGAAILLVVVALVGAGVFYVGRNEPPGASPDGGIVSDSVAATVRPVREEALSGSTSVASIDRSTDPVRRKSGDSASGASKSPDILPGSYETGIVTASPAEAAGRFQKPSRDMLEVPRGASGFSNASEELTFVRSNEWSVAVDPYDGPEEFEPSRPLRARLTADSIRKGGTVFPYAPSPFIGFRTEVKSDDVFEVRDCTANRKMASVPITGWFRKFALAPDASYFVGATPTQIEVYDLARKKSLGALSDSRLNVAQLAIWKERVVAVVSSGTKAIHVWDLPSGGLAHRIECSPGFRPTSGFTFSPGGRYLAAVSNPSTSQIDIFDLQEGSIAGSVIPRGRTRVDDVEAMGFSRDGSQLAVIWGINIFSRPKRKYSRMVIWDLPSGDIAADFEIDPRLEDQLDPVSESHELESFPGGKKWLVYSRGIIDIDSEQLIYSFPPQEDVDTFPSRRVMGADWLAAVNSPAGDPRLEPVQLTDDLLAAGARTAAAGGIASDAALPPLSAGDISNAIDGLTSARWEAQADPRQAGALPSAIRVQVRGSLRDVALSGGPKPIVVLRSGIGEDVNDVSLKFPSSFGSDKLDIFLKQPVATESELVAVSADGNEQARVRIPYSTRLHAVSPSGGLAVVEQHRTNGRLDIVRLAGAGDHVVGWRPFRFLTAENEREIRSADFVSDDVVAVVSRKRQLIVWRIPEVEGLWTLDNVLGIRVSPGGKYIFAFRRDARRVDSVDVFDALTGDGLGSMELECDVAAAAFHPNGRLLALCSSDGPNTEIHVIDVALGTVTQQFPVPVDGDNIWWADQDNLLLNGSKLVNLELQAVVWSYDPGASVLPRLQVSEQMCFASTGERAVVVHGVNVPNDRVRSQFDAEQLEKNAIVRPGDAVQISVVVPNNPIFAGVKSKVEERLSRQLKRLGFVIRANAPTTVVASASLKVGDKVTVSKIGDRSVKEVVVRKTATLDYVYRQGGRDIWKRKSSAANLSVGIFTLIAGKSTQESIDSQLARDVGRQLGATMLPRFVFKPAAAKGFGSSPLAE